LKVGEFNLMLGSNLLIFYKNSQYPISLQLLSIEKKLDSLSCLDLWLDNAMHGIQETAVCYHLNGIVQEYRVYSNSEISHLAED
jgi:hypothetical protein